MKTNHAQIQLNGEFITACQIGNLQCIKELINKKDPKCYIDISSVGADGFRAACTGGYLSIVEYFLTDTELKNDPSIKILMGSGYRSACEGGSLAVVQYLVEQYPDDTPKNREDGFFYACRYGHVEVVKYLLFEVNIEVKEELKIHLAKKIYNPLILKMIELRELNNKLEQNLLEKGYVGKKTKL